MTRLFDTYVMVDWSASNTPTSGKDSIWIAVLCADASGALRSWNPPTRMTAREQLRAVLHESVRRGERVLVGLDFPYGYPAGFAAALGLYGVPWRATWSRLANKIKDDARNRSNRFAVAAELNRQLPNPHFWGRPASQMHPGLSTKADDVRYADRDGTGLVLNQWRTVERTLKAQGIHPQPVWKLAYTGSVGSQTLTGIPVLADLIEDPELKAVSQVWPFDVLVPRFEAGRPAVVHAEIWPSIINVDQAVADHVARGRHVVRDEVQVEQLARYFWGADADGRLAQMLGAAPESCRDEEGWILGVLP